MHTIITALRKTILIRTVKDGGEGYHISGDFSVTVPQFIPFGNHISVVKNFMALLINAAPMSNFVNNNRSCLSIEGINNSISTSNA